MRGLSLGPSRFRHCASCSAGARRYGTAAGMLSRVVRKAKGRLITEQTRSQGGSSSPSAMTPAVPANSQSSGCNSGSTSSQTSAPRAASNGT